MFKGEKDMMDHVRNGQFNKERNCRVGSGGILSPERFAVFCHLLGCSLPENCLVLVFICKRTAEIRGSRRRGFGAIQIHRRGSLDSGGEGREKRSIISGRGSGLREGSIDSEIPSGNFNRSGGLR
jgi:hypothetical protein